LFSGPLCDRQLRLLGEPLAVPRQTVHREEVDACGDPLLSKRSLVVVARRAGPRRVDADDVQVVGMRIARVAHEWVDAVEPRNRLVVRRELADPYRAVALKL